MFWHNTHNFIIFKITIVVLKYLKKLKSSLMFVQAVKLSLQTECKCHGVSGSCTMKTCWKTLPPFRVIGDSLMKKYDRSRRVVATPASKGLRLTLRRGRSAKPVAPRRSELVFLEPSPNYCERDLSIGSLGTVGRMCNRTSKGEKYFWFGI